MADDLSSARGPVTGIDLIAATVGTFQRSTGTPATKSLSATGGLTGVEVAGGSTLRLDLVTSVAAASATVTIETSFDNGVTDSWRTVAAFTAQTATGTVRKVFAGVDRWVRVNLTALTTGPTTISCSGELV